MGLALLILILQGIHKGWSTLLGGSSYFIPTSLFMLRLTRYAGARASIRFVMAFFSGEVLKLGLCGILFVGAVRYASINEVYGMIGLIGAIVAFWIGSIISLSQQEAK